MAKKKFLQNVGWLIFDKVFILIVGLVVTVRIANFYGAEVYGIYEYAVSIITILAMIVTFVDSRVVKKRYENQDNSHLIYNTTLAKSLLISISVVVGVLLLLFVDQSIEFNCIYLLLLLNNVFLNLGFGLQNYFEYNLQSKKVVIAGNIAIFISSILQLVAISYNFNLIVIVIIITSASLLKLILLYIQFNKTYDIRLKSTFDTNLIKSLIIESLPLAIAAMSSIVYRRIDSVMIGSLLGNSDVAVYSVSNKMINVIAIIITPIQVSIFPKMIKWFKNDKEIYKKRYLETTSFATWLYICITACALLIGPWVFEKLFTDEYTQSFNIFKVHVLGTFFMYNAILRSSHFTLTGKTKVMTITQIIAMFVNIVLNYFLITIYGVIGAAYATVITQALSLMILNVFFNEGKFVLKLQVQGLNPYYAIKLIFHESKSFFRKLMKKN